jgi:hypothetical protein
MDALGGADRIRCLVHVLRGLSRAVVMVLYPSPRLEGFH